MKLKQFLQRILQEIIQNNNTWNTLCLVHKSFVPVNQQTCVLYCRLSDFRPKGCQKIDFAMKSWVYTSLRPFHKKQLHTVKGRFSKSTHFTIQYFRKLSASRGRVTKSHFFYSDVSEKRLTSLAGFFPFKYEPNFKHKSSICNIVEQIDAKYFRKLSASRGRVTRSHFFYYSIREKIDIFNGIFAIQISGAFSGRI